MKIADNNIGMFGITFFQNLGKLFAFDDSNNAEKYRCAKDGEYIRVTPYVSELAKEIGITQEDSSYVAFNKTLFFINIKHRAFKNAYYLKGIFDQSVGEIPKAIVSVEQTDDILQHSIDGTLSDDEKLIILKIKATDEKMFQKINEQCMANKDAFEKIIADLEALPTYDPLMIIYPKEYNDYVSKAHDRNMVGNAARYLMYRKRLEIIDLMLKNDLNTCEREKLLAAKGYPLNPNYWYQNPSKLLTPDAMMDGAYKLYENNWDYPFSFTADELLRYKIATGCSHAAIMFMALLKSLGYEDVRLVTAISNHSYNTEYCAEGRSAKPKIDKYVDSHKMVLVKVGDNSFAIINTTHYPLEIITSTYDGEPVDPATLAGKDILIPSLLNAPEIGDALFRVKAVGISNDDYLNDCTAENDARILMTGRFDDNDMNCGDFPLPEYGNNK